MLLQFGLLKIKKGEKVCLLVYLSSSDDKEGINKMVDVIIVHDLIGIHGGRLHVSKIMREVVDLIEKYNEENIF